MNAAGEQGCFAHYCHGFLPCAARTERQPRQAQSAWAEELLARLRQQSGVRAGSASKAHSRGLAVAALAARGRLGVDAEYHAPGRPIDEIVNALMQARARDAAAAYKVFTFWEAYFKALGRYPERGLLRRVAEAEHARFLLDDLHVAHATIENAFTLTLVFRP